MKPGDRVTVTFYGEVREGTVVPNHYPSSFVWVRFDNGRTIFTTRESVTPVTDMRKQER